MQTLYTFRNREIMNSLLNVLVIVLVTSVLHGEGFNSSTDYFFGNTKLNWTQAYDYCSDHNGSIILPSNMMEWKEVYYRSMNMTGKCSLFYWTGLRLDSYKCQVDGKWYYDGWAKWDDNNRDEPKSCPSNKCVIVNCDGMRTRQCHLQNNVMCVKDVSTTIKSTHSALVTSDVKTITQSTHSAVVTSGIRRAETQTTHSALVTSGVRTETQSTHSAVVTSDVRTETQSTHSAVVTSDVRTETQRTQSAVVTSDVRTTTQSSQIAGAKTILPTFFTGVVPTPNNNTLIDGSCDECCFKNNKSRQFTHEELTIVIRELKSELAVNKNNLSSNRRKLISVYDSRASSVAMGYVALAILITFLTIIVFPDMVNLVQFLYKCPMERLLYTDKVRQTYAETPDQAEEEEHV